MPLFGVSLGGSLESNKNTGKTESDSSTLTSGTKVSGKQLTPDAIDKLIYDVLSSDSGLAALASGENASGGMGSSTKGLLAQDLITKLVGEIALITAPTVESVSGTQVTEAEQTSQTKTKSKKGGAKTVICTYLVQHRYMDLNLYLRGVPHFQNLNPTVVRGYHAWAIPVVAHLDNHPRLCNWLGYVATCRYRMVVEGKFSITGWISTRVAEPICWLIGTMIPAEPEVQNG